MREIELCLAMDTGIDALINTCSVKYIVFGLNDHFIYTDKSGKYKGVISSIQRPKELWCLLACVSIFMFIRLFTVSLYMHYIGGLYKQR